MSKKENLVVELPSTGAVVDFLNSLCRVTMEIEDGVLHLEVRAQHDPEESTWDDHDFYVELPKKG